MRRSSASVVEGVAEAVRRVDHGDTVGIGGSISSGHPMVAVRELIRAGVRDLTVVAPTAGLDVDLLIAAGCVKHVVTAYVGCEDLAMIGPAYQAAVEAGTVTVADYDEAHLVQALRASAQDLPFLPWRGGVGTSLPLLNPTLVEFRDPIKGELLLAVPAIALDVSFVAATCCDERGNTHLDGAMYMDPHLAGAAAHVVVQAERIDPATIQGDPSRTMFWRSSSVVEAPLGTHPYASGALARDDDHLARYVRAARALRHGDRAPMGQYLDTFVYGPADHAEYLALVHAA